MSVQDAVSHFCRGISENIDDACIQYLSGIVNDACEGDDADVADVEDLVHGFLPDFSELSQQERHDRLWSLLTQVGNVQSTRCYVISRPELIQLKILFAPGACPPSKQQPHRGHRS